VVEDVEEVDEDVEEVVDDAEEVVDNQEEDPIFIPDDDIENQREENEDDQDGRVDPDEDLVATHRRFRNAELSNISYMLNGTNRYICTFCNAKNFLAEKTNRLQGYSICCANGKVTLPEPRYDEVIKGYFLPNDQGTNLRNIKIFKKYIRVFNNLLAFASLNVESVRPYPPVGVYA